MKKRSLSILLIICLFCAMTASCAGKEELPEYRTDVNAGPVTVVIDVDFDSSILSSPSIPSPTKRTFEKSEVVIDGKEIKGFKKLMKELGGPEDITLEFPPVYGTDRDNYLTHLRTELLAGKGPDVIICKGGFGYTSYVTKNNDYEGAEGEGIFKFPRQAMDSRFFLPLDNYIENAQFMEWDKLTPVIMEAGKNERGQLLLPMSYTMPVTFFRQEDYHPEHSLTATYDEMLAGDDYARRAAINSSMYQTLVYRDLIDDEKDKLAITEEEYLGYVRTWAEQMEARDSEDSGIVSTVRNMGVMSTDREILREKFAESDISMVPMYCKEGGYGASVCVFGAVNANTENPAGAFFVLDYLLSREGQRSDMYAHITLNNSLPTYEGIMQKGPEWAVYTGVDGEKWYMSEADYAEFEELRDNISWARFSTPIEQVFWNPGSTYLYDEENTKYLETLVHDNYVLMNMMLGES